MISVVTLAVCIVAAFLAAITALLGERSAFPGWLTIGLAILVALIVYSLGPGVLS